MAGSKGLGYTMVALGLLLLMISSAYALAHLVGILEIGKFGIPKGFEELSASLMFTISKILFLGVVVWIGGILIDRGIRVLRELAKPTKPEVRKP